jgi:WD40 repeat protein
VWDAATGHSIAEVTGLAGEVMHVGWSAAGARVITEDSLANAIQVWDVARGTKLSLGGAEIESDRALDRALVDDGKQVRVVELAHGATIATLPGVTPLASLAISSDGRLAFAEREHGPARVFDTTSGAPIATLAGAEGSTARPVFSPDDRAVAGSPGGKGVQVWDVATGALRVSLQGRGQEVESIVWSPDGGMIATTSADRTAKIWDAVNGSLLASLAHEDTVADTLWSPDGAHLATVVLGAAGLRLWDVHLDRATPAAVAAQVRCTVPFRIVDGRALPAAIDRAACP